MYKGSNINKLRDSYASDQSIEDIIHRAQKINRVSQEGDQLAQVLIAEQEMMESPMTEMLGGNSP